MRKAMQESVRQMLNTNKDTALLLVDIGAWPFRDLLEAYPNRAKNIGIFEAGTVSLAAGLSLMGITPIVYGISPFIVQRALEQLKLDFIYQKTGGNFITTGASYDFSTLGYSHYCPEDVATLLQLPGMEILTPATPDQFRSLWEACSMNGNPSYFRMTDHPSTRNPAAIFGKASRLQEGKKALVITAAELLDTVADACQGEDVTVLHYSTITPFDQETIRRQYRERVLICEPFYQGTMAPLVLDALQGHPVLLRSLGVPREVLRTYGTKAEKDLHLGLTKESISRTLREFLEG